MHRALLVLLLALGPSSPAFDWATGLVSAASPSKATTDAGNLWDPDGAETDAGSQWDPNGAETDAGSRWDPNG
jgi:hypothetical protein